MVLCCDRRAQALSRSGFTVRMPDNLDTHGAAPGRPGAAAELNAMENVWQVLRENWLSNRIFTSYKDVLDHCCDAWKRLTDQPWRIMSIGLRDWAHRF
jgi:hypothetical protein